jgi:hypothetical protein
MRISQARNSPSTHRQRIIPGVNAIRRATTSAAAVILLRRAEKNLRASTAWRKSAAQFGSPLTRAMERRFRRSARSLTRRRALTAIRRSGCGLKLRRSTAGAADRGGAPGGAARPKQTIPARGRSVARAAPGAQAGGNIRPRGAATLWRLPALHYSACGLAWFRLALFRLAWFRLATVA